MSDDDGPSDGEEPASAAVSPKQALEAMLFVGIVDGSPLDAERVAALLPGVSAREVVALLRELQAEYQANHCPYEIRTEGRGYRLALRAEYGALRAKVRSRVRHVRLSKGAIEVLALVAYRGAMTADEVSQRRGKSSAGVIAQLVRRQLLRIERTSGDAAPMRYATTRRFLDLFGLESLADLPDYQDVEWH